MQDVKVKQGAEKPRGISWDRGDGVQGNYSAIGVSVVPGTAGAEITEGLVIGSKGKGFSEKASG